MRARERNPQRALTPAGRCLIAVVASVPFFLLFLVLYQIMLHAAEPSGGVRVGVIYMLQIGLLLGAIVNGAVGLWLWPRYKSTEPRKRAAQAVTLVIGLIYAATQIALGTFASGANLLLVGSLAIGLMLFDQRTMSIATGACAVLIVIYDSLVVLGYARYAPVLTETAFNGVEPTWWWDIWRSTLFYCGIAVLVTLILWLFDQIKRQQRQLEKLSQTDVLTGLANRHYFIERLRAEARRRDRFSRPFSVVMLDADHFKRINDTYGHHVGDEVLRRLAEVLTTLRRPTDVAARLGGEEFALLLPETQLPAAQALCERLAESLSQCEFTHADQRFFVTVSMGLVECRSESGEQALKLADRNLYVAKQQGRDRIVSSIEGESGELPTKKHSETQLIAGGIAP